MRRSLPLPSSSLRISSNSSSSSTFFTQLRHASLPGWQTSNSTRDQRTREQREVDRRARQLEKLPRPELLHDFQYPYEKTVLCDAWFQPPVYKTELDTPSLFNLYPPNDFFVYFNAQDFERSQLPPVPEVDFRKLSSSSSSNSSNNNINEWKQHRILADQYLRKHEVVPQLVPNVDHSVNLSVVFGTSSTNRDELVRSNFWKTSLYGNFMELKESHFVKEVEIDADEDGEGGNNNKSSNNNQQQVPVRDETATPSIFLSLPPSSSSSSTTNPDQLYTLLIVSPDYPCRAEPNDTFFLHYAVCNLKANNINKSSEPIDVSGKQVVSYVPPLPTEDAGCARVLCVLYPQTKEFTGNNNLVELPFEKRACFRLHDTSSTFFGNNDINNSNSSSDGTKKQQHPIQQLESVIDPTTASACTFFQTVWDIQVQEWYEANELPEPRYYPDDIVDLLEYNALPRDFFHVSSRHNAYGGVQEEDVLEQNDPLLPRQNTASSRMSAHTLLSKDGKNMIRPKNQ